MCIVRVLVSRRSLSQVRPLALGIVWLAASINPGLPRSFAEREHELSRKALEKFFVRGSRIILWGGGGGGGGGGGRRGHYGEFPGISIVFSIIPNIIG